MKDIHEIPNTGATEEQIKNEDENKTQFFFSTQICYLNNEYAKEFYNWLMVHSPLMWSQC